MNLTSSQIYRGMPDARCVIVKILVSNPRRKAQLQPVYGPKTRRSCQWHIHAWPDLIMTSRGWMAKVRYIVAIRTDLSARKEGTVTGFRIAQRPLRVERPLSNASHPRNLHAPLVKTRLSWVNDWQVDTPSQPFPACCSVVSVPCGSPRVQKSRSCWLKGLASGRTPCRSKWDGWMAV